MKNLVKRESTMLKKYEERRYKSDTQFRDDIIRFLEDLEAEEKEIKTNREFTWALAAISRWTHYLSMRFDVFLSIKSPDLRDFPDLQKDEVVIEEIENVHESGGMNLQDLAKNFENWCHRVDQLMTRVVERQSLAQAEDSRIYTDLQETITNQFDYISKQLIEHHYEMTSQHEKQTSQILDASGKPYSR